MYTHTHTHTCTCMHAYKTKLRLCLCKDIDPYDPDLHYQGKTSAHVTAFRAQLLPSVIKERPLRAQGLVTPRKSEDVGFVFVGLLSNLPNSLNYSEHNSNQISNPIVS